MKPSFSGAVVVMMLLAAAAEAGAPGESTTRASRSGRFEALRGVAPYLVFRRRDPRSEGAWYSWKRYLDDFGGCNDG
jgi:hypothetical protein